jgi:hypothetical protein
VTSRIRAVAWSTSTPECLYLGSAVTRAKAPDSFSLDVELRLVKAALIYADEVSVDLASLWSRVAPKTGVFGPPEDERPSPDEYYRLHGRELVRFARQPEWQETLGLADRCRRQCDELLKAHSVGALSLEGRASAFVDGWSWGAEEDMADADIPIVDLGAAETLRMDTAGAARTAAQGLFVGLTLGELRAFPDADMDVVLDVRDRLQPSRARFRQAMTEAGRSLATADASELADACRYLRQTEVEPALLEIGEALEDLGAVPTLLRLASDKAAMAAAVTAISAMASVAHAPIEVHALFAALGSAGSTAAAVKELGSRRKIKKAVAKRPYWLLHEADRIALEK